jgi:hypothetical protein
MMARTRKPALNRFDLAIYVEPGMVFLDFGGSGPSAVFDEDNSEQLKAVLPLVHALRELGIAAGMPDKVKYRSLATQ